MAEMRQRAAREIADIQAVKKVWGGSSIGRASALQAEGCRFNPGPLHQY